MVKDPLQQPPWCLPLRVLGHSFVGEQFLAKVALSTQHTGQRLYFPACHIGDTVYQTIRCKHRELRSWCSHLVGYCHIRHCARLFRFRNWGLLLSPHRPFVVHTTYSVSNNPKRIARKNSTTATATPNNEF